MVKLSDMIGLVPSSQTGNSFPLVRVVHRDFLLDRFYGAMHTVYLHGGGGGGGGMTARGVRALRQSYPISSAISQSMIGDLQVSCNFLQVRDLLSDLRRWNMTSVGRHNVVAYLPTFENKN